MINSGVRTVFCARVKRGGRHFCVLVRGDAVPAPRDLENFCLVGQKSWTRNFIDPTTLEKHLSRGDEV